MSTRVLMACQVVLLSCSLTGCTIWSLPRTLSKVQDRFAETASPTQSTTNSSSQSHGLVPVFVDENGVERHLATPPARVKVAQLQPDQFCELTFASPANDATSRPANKTVAGRIIAIDETDLVLAEAIKIDRQPVMTESRSFVRRIPYFNRLYKDVAIFTMPVPIPGEVRIPRASVQQATTIPAEMWPSFRQDGMGRVGLDFNVNVR